MIYTVLRGESKWRLQRFFENGRSQAVRLPKKFRFNTDEVIVQQLGDAVILVPKESLWQTFMAGLDGFYQRCFCGWKRSRCSERERKSVTYMLDTNICIYAMKNKPENVLQRLKKELNSGVCISSITLAELEYGMKHSSNPAKNEQALLRFLIPLSILPFGAVAATEYGAIRTYLQNNGTQSDRWIC